MNADTSKQQTDDYQNHLVCLHPLTILKCQSHMSKVLLPNSTRDTSMSMSFSTFSSSSSPSSSSLMCSSYFSSLWSSTSSSFPSHYRHRPPPPPPFYLVEWLVRIRSMLFSSYPSSFSMLSSLSLLSSSTSSSFTSRHSCRRHRRPPPPQPPCCWCCGWSDSEVLVHEHVQVHAQVNRKRKKIRGANGTFF